MTSARRPRRSSPFLLLLKRVVSGVMPAADGGPPLAMRHARTRLLWLLASVAGLVLGAVVGLLLALAWQAVPDVPLLLLGLIAGVLLGVAAAAVAGAWMRRLRLRAALAYVIAPLLVAGAPLLLLASAWTAIRKRSKRSAR